MKMAIYLQISRVFCTDGRITCQLLNVDGINVVRQTAGHYNRNLVLSS